MGFADHQNSFSRLFLLLCAAVLLCYLCCCSWVLARSLLSFPSIPSIPPFYPLPPSCHLPLPHLLNATKRLHVMLSALLALWPVLNNVGLLLAPLLPPHLLPLPLPLLLLFPLSLLLLLPLPLL